MGAFSEIFFLPVTIVFCNTLLIHYYTKILQTGHFILQTSPQEKHLQKKWSMPQRSKGKLIQDGNKNNIWRRILWGVNSCTKWAFLGYFEKNPKNADIVRQFMPPEFFSRIFFLFCRFWPHIAKGHLLLKTCRGHMRKFRLKSQKLAEILRFENFKIMRFFPFVDAEKLP